MSGVFIAFEGGEGAGKSTQAAILESKLRRRGYQAVLVHEPGSTPLGDYLRTFLVNNEPIVPSAELLLFEASRAQLVGERIRPLLDDGAVVIADRFAGSTVAYQGHGRGIKLDSIRWLNDFATGRLYPDLTILLNIDPLIGLERVNSRQLQLALPMADAPDRFEEEVLAFHDNVRRGFLEQAESDPDHWHIVDGHRSIVQVSTAVRVAVEGLLTVKIPSGCIS
jgi:dTMP kinase